MHYYEVAPTQIIRTDSESFTYCSGNPLLIGQIVAIEVGKKTFVGVVMSKSKKPTYKTKPILTVIDQSPLPIPLLKLAKWMSGYYATPLATVFQTILPRGIQKKRRIQSSGPLNITSRKRTNILFNAEQSAATDTISSSDSGTFLVQGVTGSGKTEVYIELAKRALINNRSAIILVPEIALTSQLISEFSQHFSDLLVTHSHMTESQRHAVWLEALNSDSARVVIGPRSALFAPLKDVGIIIVDEAHEPSYKQEQAPRYSALRVATMLTRFHNSKAVFGSATPSVVDRYIADLANHPVIMLNNVARTGSLPPSVQLIDMTKRENFSAHRFLSKQLTSQIQETLAEGKQALIFHNRRGSATTTLCKKCGWTAECPRCFVPMTLHADKGTLHCHICDYSAKIPTSCPKCGDTDIVYKGIGTKLIESELRKLFPSANIARFDADNNAEESVNMRYSDLYDGKIDIAIGTQVIAKGLDLPNLRTVGVIQADAGLALPDFGSGERVFQLLAQVVGRVGRNEHKTQVIVQSYQATHPSIKYGIIQDYESFYQNTLTDRKNGLFPPFTHMLKLTCIYKTEAAAITNAKKIATLLRQKVNPDVQILGPAPAFYERKYDTYRWQLILKSPKREYLIDALALVPPTHWQSELDPTSLL